MTNLNLFWILSIHSNKMILIDKREREREREGNQSSFCFNPKIGLIFLFIIKI